MTIDKLPKDTDEFVAMLVAEYGPAERKDEYTGKEISEKEAEENRVFWFVAIQEASMVFDSCSTKDLAGSILSGFGPVDRAFVDSWLATLDYGTEPEDAEALGEAMEEDAIENFASSVEGHFGRG